MIDTTLARAVERFASVTRHTPDMELDRPWAWHAYDSEGVRFAFFRTYEELRELAVLTATERATQGATVTPAQHILAQYHAAYRDLQAVVFDADGESVERAPAEAEWPLRTVLAHIVEADAGFYVLVRYALDRHRGGGELPAEIPESAWDEIIGMDEAAFTAIIQGPVEALRAYHDALHQWVLGEFSGIAEDELAKPSRYWEGYDLPLRFRLHRFDSHLRQHTIQAVKTLEAVGQAPAEVRQLRRLLYAALAEAEGMTIGMWDVAAGRRRAVAEAITARADEIAGILIEGAR